MKGLLVIAHGAPSLEWVETVQQALHLNEAPVPAVLTFLEHVPGVDIQSGIDQLLRAGVSGITAVPLFVCSHSVHIEEIKYLLGLPSQVTLPHGPTNCPVPITLSPAMDDHLLIAEILADRMLSLGPSGSGMIVAYGANLADDLKVWDKNVGALAAEVSRATGRSVDVAWLTLNNIADKAKVLCDKHGSVAVVPLLLSHSHYTKVKIPEALACAGLVRYSGEPLLPHTNITRWILSHI